MKKIIVEIFPYDDGCIGTHNIELHISELHEKVIIETANHYKNYQFWFNKNEPKFDSIDDYEYFGSPMSIAINLPIAEWDLNTYGVNTTRVNIQGDSCFTTGSNILLESSIVKINELRDYEPTN